MYRLNPKQEAWVCALESGEYVQGTGYLRKLRPATAESQAIKDSQFCCLGVACEVYARMENICDYGCLHAQDAMRDTGVFVYEDTSMSLSVRARDYFGFYGDSGDLQDMDYDAAEAICGHSSLAGANDEGVSFQEIAAFIRAYPECVFNKTTLIKITDEIPTEP